MKKGLWAVLVLFLAMPAMPARTETPSLRLTAPAWMLRDDNPLRAGKPYDGAVEVELPGYRHDPPMTVPAALHAAWDESGWIEVIDTDLRRPDN